MKKIIAICVTLLIFILGVKAVNAKEPTSFFDEEVTYLAGSMSATEVDNNCKALFGDPEAKGDLAYYMQKGLDIIKYLGIVLCIVLTIVDFAKALFSNDKDMLKPLSKKAFSRLIYAVLLFFLPIIIKVLLSVVGAYGTCNIQ